MTDCNGVSVLCIMHKTLIGFDDNIEHPMNKHLGVSLLSFTDRIPVLRIRFCLIFVSAAIFNKEEDIGTYTIKAVDDPRTLNKILYIRPPANTISFNEIVSLWETKIGKTVEKVYVPDEQLLEKIQGW